MYNLACSNGNTFITFDDLLSSTTVPNGYNNINWDNARTQTKTTNTSGYYTGIVSAPNSIFNYFGRDITMESANSNLFTMHSFAIAAAWYDNLQLTVVGYNSNNIIASNTFTIQVFSVSYLTLTGYVGLDKVIFSTSGGTKNAAVSGSGTHFAMDNICLSFI